MHIKIINNNNNNERSKKLIFLLEPDGRVTYNIQGGLDLWDLSRRFVGNGNG